MQPGPRQSGSSGETSERVSRLLPLASKADVALFDLCSTLPLPGPQGPEQSDKSGEEKERDREEGEGSGPRALVEDGAVAASNCRGSLRHSHQSQCQSLLPLTWPRSPLHAPPARQTPRPSAREPSRRRVVAAVEKLVEGRPLAARLARGGRPREQGGQGRAARRTGAGAHAVARDATRHGGGTPPPPFLSSTQPTTRTISPPHLDTLLSSAPALWLSSTSLAPIDNPHHPP